MCKLLKVSTSGFYEYLRFKESKRSVYDKQILIEILKIYNDSRKTYGSPRVTSSLHDKGYTISRVKVARIMNRNHISSITKKKYKVTTNSKHKYPVSPNLLKRQFSVKSPSKVWVSDITYIATQEGWIYLTTVIDLFDRKVIGWSLSENMKCNSTVIPALKMALNNRDVERDTIFHSDRGVQYACNEFRDLISLFNLTQSMSRKGDCWDNAVAESFFSTIKKECVRKSIFFSRKIAKIEIIYYIEGWYNIKRKHSSLGYKSPAEYGRKYKLANVA